MKRRDGVKLRGSVWYIRLPSGKSGLRSEERTTASSRKEAVAARNKRLVQLREGQYDPEAAKTLVDELIEDLKRYYRVNGRNEKEIAQRWSHLSPVFGKHLASAVTMSQLTKYIESRLAEQTKVDKKTKSGKMTKPATVQRELAALHRAFTLGFQAGKVYRVPPFPSIAINNAREVYFTRSERDALLKELPDGFLRPFVIVAYWIGFRRGELLKLEWKAVDFDRGTVRLGVGTTKNKDGRLVFLPAEALAALKAWRERTSAVERKQSRIITHVFHRDGEPIPVRNFPYDVWHAACERANIGHKVPHDFRRTMARNYRSSGEAESVIMRIGGWKTRSVFDRYAIVREDDLKRASERVVDSNGARMGQTIPIDESRGEKHGA